MGDHRYVECPVCGGQMVSPRNESWGGWTADEDANQVSAAGRVVQLRPHEFAIFTALLRAHGRVVRKRYLIDSVYGEDAEPHSNTVSVWMHRLRKKFPGAIPPAGQQGLWRLLPVGMIVAALPQR